MRYHAGDLPQRTYDPDKARFHLKKAGMEGFKHELSGSEDLYAGNMDSILLYKEQRGESGHRDRPQARMPSHGYWSEVWLKHPWCAAYWNGRPTEDWMFSVAYAADADWNATHWKHDKFNQLLKAARAEVDEAKRRDMYIEMQSITRDEGGAIIPGFGNHIMAHSSKVAHPETVAGNLDMDGYKMLREVVVRLGDRLAERHDARGGGPVPPASVLRRQGPARRRRACWAHTQRVRHDRR